MCVITLTDGRIFKFKLLRSYVTSIILIPPTQLSLDPGGEAKIQFIINPSDAPLNLNVEDPECQIALNVIEPATRSALTVNEPEYFSIAKIDSVTNSKGEIIPGQYIATIKDGEKAVGYSKTVVLVVIGENDSQISSEPISIQSTFYPEIFATGLPVAIVNTPGGAPIQTKETWIPQATITIYNEKGELDYEGSLSIRGRGNSTWSYPKKPYALKLDKKSKILGMAKHKRWCLLANWMDRTLMRNAVAFEISRGTGLDYTPSGEFVELILNGQHCGNYFLTEQIKVDENRVNIAELDPGATSGDAITGGYIFELDVYFDELYKFSSETKNLPWMFKDPDEVNQAQFDFVQNYVNEMESALYEEEKFKAREFEQYMDLNSFVDWWFVHELAINGEPGHPKSSYMTKDQNGKIKAGPVWDFDFMTFSPSYSKRFLLLEAIYYDQLFKDKEFVKLVKERWMLHKPKFDAIASFIDNLNERLRKSDQINAKMWPIYWENWDVNGDERLSFEDAVKRMRKTYLDKLNWMDAQIREM